MKNYKQYPHKCDFCKEEFTSIKRKSSFCSERCRNQNNRQKIVENDLRNNPDNAVKCEICGLNFKGHLTAHFKFHNITKKEYIEKFPNSIIFSKVYIQKCSDKIKGENNPGFNHGGKLSPFSKNFVKYKDMSDDEKEEIVSNLFSVAKTTTKDNNNVTTSLDYYLSRGHDSDTAKQLLANRQQTFSLKTCIEKYGEEEGTTRWQERQDKWQKTLKSKSYEERQRINKLKLTRCGSVSKTEKVLLEALRENSIPAEGQYMIDSESGYLYDIRYKNKLIEFNGRYWHCDPRVYAPTFINKTKKKTASEIWEYDNRKNEYAKSFGFDVLVVWEDDFRNSKEKVIQQCLNFMRQ